MEDGPGRKAGLYEIRWDCGVGRTGDTDRGTVARVVH